MRAVYGRGNLVVRLDRDTSEIIDTDYEHIASIPKVATGTDIQENKVFVGLRSGIGLYSLLAFLQFYINYATCAGN